MKPLRGMRPQDIAILLKIVSLGKKAWKTTDLASRLYISQSEISQSLHRNWSAGLLDDSKRNVHKGSLVEFLIHVVKYVYPQKPRPNCPRDPNSTLCATAVEIDTVNWRCVRMA